MKFFARLFSFLKSKRQPTPAAVTRRPRQVEHPDPPFFQRIIADSTTPPNSDVAEREFHVVIHKGIPYWALFRCPSGCGEVVSLPLRPSGGQRWNVTTGQNGTPTLSPSVWRNRGCMSHFWVRDGRIIWCQDTGMAPYVSRPDLYRRRNR